jgi:hypothetical protein
MCHHIAFHYRDLLKEIELGSVLCFVIPYHPGIVACSQNKSVTVYHSAAATPFFFFWKRSHTQGRQYVNIHVPRYPGIHVCLSISWLSERIYTHAAIS